MLEWFREVESLQVSLLGWKESIRRAKILREHDFSTQEVSASM